MSADAFASFAAGLARANVAEYAALLARHASTAIDTRLLIGYLDWRQRTKPKAGRSHVHNNGFLKPGLWRHPGSEASLRLHVWDPCSEATSMTPSIHNHRWSFASVVVVGRLEFANYEAIPAPEGLFTMCEVSDGDTSGVKKQSAAMRCDLRTLATYELPAGHVHALHRQLHSTPAPLSCAATLVLTAPPSSPFSQVVRPCSEAKSVAVLASAETLAGAEVERAVERVIGWVDAAR